ncbi:protein HID1-like isoform X1 [Hydractinia symbiolongicarpus]|uniref:protein HID1-like isoform X1 n=1 Tax=Hydractinia symbiolongicarpus TaxID=13093 RepID=UPI0025512DFF|nr:protein HID1-like isoform X1 [Hydractinia symbiolongicarpus]XP_057310817.1 protein HID1-like isoform X1 [Hydractinia symbiolongicarpus]
MGAADSKLNFRQAVVQLTSKKTPVEVNDEAFWEQFWMDSITNVNDIFALIPAAEIRTLREECPSNLATLCYKCVEKLVNAASTGCSGQSEHLAVLNCCRLLTRVMPYIFEDPDWRGFFWSTVPGQGEAERSTESQEETATPLAQSLVAAVCDLLFCPDFTVFAKRSGPDNPEDLANIDSCAYIWEAGVGFASSPPHVAAHDLNRAELLKLLLTCFSEAMYLPPAEAPNTPNKWLQYFASSENRHALPLFTSLLNVVCSYDPVGYGIPYNHVMFNDTREPLIEVALQLLIVVLDYDMEQQQILENINNPDQSFEGTGPENLFCNYLTRIHREEDFHFILRGITQLLQNPLIQTYLPNSCKKIGFHQELLVLFWKLCDLNKKFLFYVLKSSDVLNVLVPILYHLNDSRGDPSRIGLMHIGVFILLLLSGERNFGVRLNKPYSVRIPMDIPVFNGTHSDLLIIVFHKIITTGHQRLHPLFDCLLTIIVNVSPYLKSLSMVAANKLLHLLEAFSTPWFLFANSTNHHLVFFLLETFNNIIQYQFDGNAHLVYAIIRKRNVFHQLANLPTDPSGIKKPGKHERKSSESSVDEGNIVQPTLANIPTTTKTVQNPNAAEEATTSQKEQDETIDASYDVTAPVNREGNMRRANIGEKGVGGGFAPTSEWVHSWKQKLPLQTIMRLLQVLVPQVEKICIDKGLTDESEIIKFLQHGTLVGLLPVPHPILIRKYQANSGTQLWFRTYMWGIIYLRNIDPPIWYDTDVRLFEIQRV